MPKTRATSTHCSPAKRLSWCLPIRRTMSPSMGMRQAWVAYGIVNSPWRVGEMSTPTYLNFLRTVCGNLVEVSADGSIHFMCMDWRHAKVLLLAADGIYSELKNICVWDKTNGGLGSFYRSKHELVFVYGSRVPPRT